MQVIDEKKCKQCDTIIIGAGIAGISCAYHLIVESNFKGRVILLEGRGRPGGRIIGETIGGKHIELGANWIHGIINNPIYNLAVRYKLIDPLDINGLSCKDEFSRMGGLTSAGDPVPYKTIVSVYKFYFSLLKRCENFYVGIKKGNVFHEESSSGNHSVGSWMAKEIKNYLETVNESDRMLISAILDNFLARETCISGCNSMDQVSLPYFGAYEELPGGNVTIPNGYSQLIDCLLDEIQFKLQRESRTQDFQLHLNQPVTKIEWPGIGSILKQSTQVTTNSGTIYSCSHVVITIPLGVLKLSHGQLFTPPLPQYKIDCIQRMGYGVVDKIFLEFKDPLSPKFIDPTVTEILTFWLPQDLSSIGWAAKIYSIAKVSERLLLVWLSGDEAATVEKSKESQVRDHLMQLIRKLLKTPDLPDPINLAITRWKNDPFSQGSYSYIAVDSSVNDIENFAQPIYSNPGQEKPDLLFAGESCHPSFFSTTHGAFLTGRKAALYLVDTENINSSNDTDKNIDSSKKTSNL